MTILRCGSCAASSMVELNAEICILFPGLKRLDLEPVLALKKLTVCLECGSIQFGLSANELDHVKESTARLVAAMTNGVRG
jgi:hypothetical protein